MTDHVDKDPSLCYSESSPNPTPVGETILWKYRERLYYYEDLDPGYAAEHYKKYSEPPSFIGVPYRRINPNIQLGQMQSQPCNGTNPPTPTHPYDPSSQGQTSTIYFERVINHEWDKLSTAASVITATSAAALAIPGLAGTDAYWLVNCSFCAALGVSLEGLLLVHYLGVMSGGASDETLGRLARGKLRLFGIKVNPIIPAVIMSLPMSFATYSALYLLAGTMVMVLKGRRGPDDSPTQLPSASYYLPTIPIVFGLFCLLIAILVCEAGTYYEIRTRQINEKRWRQRKIAERGLVNMTLVGAAAMGPALHPNQIPILYHHVALGLQRAPHMHSSAGSDTQQANGMTLTP
ncbi:hypothetical protein B0J17DRAFT_633643 [Rhizoctonia solani]|nr:hypothetical protein B0J17DRAFT_633643 [Rhizoctonia solani]